MDADRSRFLMILALFIVGLLIARFFVFVPIGHNDASRWSAIWSVVHQGSFAIDDAPWAHTVDKMKRTVDGEEHLYSSKPAFMATLGAALYRPLYHAGVVLGESGYATHIIFVLILFFFNLIPLAIFIYFYDQLLGEMGVTGVSRNLCLVAAALGTYVTGYAFTLNNHVPAAAAVMVALFFAAKAFRGNGSTRGCIIGGAAFGLAACFEIAVLAAFPLMVLAHWNKIKRIDWMPLAGWSLGFILCFSLLFLAEYAALGDPFPNTVHALFGHSYAGYEGGDLARMYANKREVSWGERLFQMTLGHHGTLILTPLFVISLLGVRKAFLEEKAMVVGILVTLGVVFTVYTFKGFGYGGVCQGMRWFIWLTPLFLYLMPHGLRVIDGWRSAAARKSLLYVCFSISIFSTIYCLPNPWSTSWWDQGMLKIAQSLGLL